MGTSRRVARKASKILRSDRVSYDVEFAQIEAGETGPQPKRNLRMTVSHAGLAHSTYDPNRSDS
jgi:hypothetical protein